MDMDSNIINRSTERFSANTDQFFTEYDLLHQNRRTNKDTAVHVYVLYIGC